MKNSQEFSLNLVLYSFESLSLGLVLAWLLLVGQVWVMRDNVVVSLSLFPLELLLYIDKLCFIMCSRFGGI